MSRDHREKILAALVEKYDPLGILVYGSYADGTENETSDFDALLLTEGMTAHDTSVVAGTPLDVFVRPRASFESDFDPVEFLQVSEALVVLDKDGVATRLKEAVRSYTESLPMKSEEEMREAIGWCRKMLARAEREDAEAYFRWHWLLTDSLEIYTDFFRSDYPGPKKALKEMERRDPEAFRLYGAALRKFTRDALADWISYLERQFEKRGEIT